MIDPESQVPEISSRSLTDGVTLFRTLLAEIRPEIDSDEMTMCPVCKTTVDDFETTGLLGCPACYAAFRLDRG